MKNIFLKLSLLSVLAVSSLSLSGCAQKNDKDLNYYGTPIVKYSEVLENTSKEENYQKIVNEVFHKSKIIESDLFKILSSNYNENYFDRDNINKQKENEKIINFYSKKYVMSNDNISQSQLNDIIKVSVNEAFKSNVGFKQIDDFVLNKIYGLTTFQLLKNVNIDYKNVDINLLEYEYLNHLKIKNNNVYFNIFNTSKMLKHINQEENPINYFNFQKNRLLSKTKNSTMEELSILKELDLTVDIYQKVFLSMKFPKVMSYDQRMNEIIKPIRNNKNNENYLGVKLN